MNEQRLVTLILVVVLVLGAAALLAVHFATNDDKNTEPGSSPTRMTETRVSDEPAQEVSSPPVAAPEPKEVLKKQPEKETAPGAPSPEGPQIASREKVPTGESVRGLEENTEREVPAQSLAAIEEGEPLKEQPARETKLADVSPERSHVLIHETDKSNGSFNTAQDITEGTIIGKRGTSGDRSDYYKVQATGKMMTLRLKPFLKTKKGRSALSVFDAEKKSMGKFLRETGGAMTLSVKAGAVYYVKLDLRSAPIKEPEYELDVKFE